MPNKKIAILAIAIFVSVAVSTSAYLLAADTTSQIITNIEEILKANPLKPGEKGQMINVAQDDTISLFVVRAVDGFILKSHFHKAHAETVYVVKGTGQVLINDRWIDLKPGSLHFNPQGKIHSVRQTGNEPLVLISIFTPAMREPDRQFVQ